MEHRQISTIQKPTCTSPTETCQAPFAKLCTPNIFGVCLMYEPKWLPVLFFFFLGGGALVSLSIVIAQHFSKTLFQLLRSLRYCMQAIVPARGFLIVGFRHVCCACEETRNEPAKSNNIVQGSGLLCNGHIRSSREDNNAHCWFWLEGEFG